MPAAEDTVSFDDAKVRELKELVVRPGKRKYSKKNNPGVELIEKVRKDRKRVDPSKSDHYSYEKYSKTVIALNDFDIAMTEQEGKIGSQFNFLRHFIDTAEWTGKEVLDISLKEKYSRVIKDKEIGEVEIVEGLRSYGLDDDFNKDNVRKVLEDLFKEIDIYDNDIGLMQTRFVSPLSVIGTDYYKFEISDTVKVGGEDCIELTFVPFSPEAISFSGKLFIPVAGDTKYIKRISMRVPKAANLNYIDNLFVSQNYKIDSLNNVHKTLDDLTLEMQFAPGTPKLYGSRKVVYDKFSYIPQLISDTKIMSGEKEIVNKNAEKRGDQYWDKFRKLSLSHAENNMGDMMLMLRKQPILYWTEKVLKVIVNGYIPTGNPSKFNIGPVNSLLSYNTAEGMRFRLGGITTTKLSDHIFGRGYVAYGLKDRKIKYGGELEYSFIEKKYTPREFPVNSIRVSYQYDIDQLGQHYLFSSADNFVLSLTRKKNDLITYRRLADISYNMEFRNNLSFSLHLYHETQEASPWVPFLTGNGIYNKEYRQAGGKIVLRFAPGEKTVATNSSRLLVNKDAPVFLLSHEFGFKGILRSNFAINKTELSVQKRFRLSAFGYTDIIFKGGILWNAVPFPSLLWQNANISYTIQPESYTLLNPMEFAMDKYASWDLTYFMNGLLLNRIPIINKLKLREVITFKGFVGALSAKNNPDYNPELYRFPEQSHTQAMGKTPYMEIGVGLDNILTIIRLDYVWRLTYKDLPGIDKRGLRVSLHFSF